MDKDRSKLNSNKRSACTKCTKPDTCIHLRTLRQQQMENNSSTRVLHMVQNFQENRSDEDIFFDCMSFGDNDNGCKSSSCKSSSGKSSNQKGTGQCPTKSEGSKFDDLEALREVLERVNERLQMSCKKSSCRKSCNATLEITARLITDSESNPNCRFQGRPVTMKMPLEFDPSTGQFGTKSVESSRHMCKKPCSQSSYSQSYSGCPALIYMQDERPSPRQAPDANANAEAENDDNDNIPNRSQKMQTDESYLKDKWRPNRTDFEQESNDVSVKSSQTDTQSKKEVPIPSKPSQTDTSFLYDQYVRSRNKNTTQDSPSQTVLKPELNLMGNLRYPTQYVPGMQETKISAPSNTSSRNISRRPSEPSVPRTDAMSQSNGEKCKCADPSLNVCPSKSMPIICDPNAVTSNAFQSTCSKQSTQPSQDTSKWYSLESDTSTRMDPAASKPVFCPMKSCKSMPAESMLSRCTCKSDGDLDNFKSIQSSHLGYAPLDLESNMQSTRSKSTKCNIKSTQSTQSLPCGEHSKNTPCVTVVYCPLRGYVNGPTSIDIEMGQYPNDPSNDATNWQSARSNISDSCGPNSTCICSDSTFTKSKDTCFRTVEGNPTEATAWDSARSDNCNVCASNDPTTAPAWKSLKSDKSCTCGSNKEDPMETNPTTATAWNSVRSERSCLCGSNKQNTDEINPTTATPWHSVKSTKSCVCDSRNENLMTKPSNTCFLSMESNKTAVTAWNSLKPDGSCACNTSSQIPRTSNPPTIAWMSAKSDKSCGSNNVNLSDTETCSTIRKSVPTAVPTTASATPWMSIKSDKPCRCGSSNQSPGSKSSNTEQTSSRSRSVMAKVTCLCSSEERAKLGDMGREDYDGPPFARVEESNNDTDVSAVDPCLISAAGTDSEAYVKNVEEEPIYNTCYIPSQGTKVVFMKADGFCDCQSSSNTSLQENAGKDGNKSVEDSPRDQDEQTMAKKSKSSSCMCSKVLSEDLKSHPRSQNPSMKSAMSCSCAKEAGQDYKSERSNQTTCSCIKTSKYDISMNDFSMEPESVGVVMTCDTTVCVDKETFDKLSSAASAQNARDRLFNMVNLVTSNRDPSLNRSEVAQQIIRELTLMLRKEEEESKPPKLSFEDCMEAVQRGERPVKKQYKTQTEINRLQCLDRMEQYLQTCFPQKKKIQEMEIVAFEIDPDFDPYRRSPSPVTEPEIRDEPMFRSCYTDIDARFMTPKGGSTGTPSTVQSPGSLKMDSDSKIPSPDASPQLRDAPEALSRVSVEPQASPQLSDGIEALSSPSSDPNGPPQPSDGAEASSRASADPKPSAQPSDGPETTSRVSSEPQGSPQPSDGPETASRGSAGPRASAQLSDRPEASSRASSEPKASPRASSEPKVSSRPSAESKALLESNAEPDVSSRPNEEFLSTQQPNSGLPCGNELCPEATSQGPKSTMDSCQLCELDPNDPLSPLTDRERLLCEYLLRRMCELCDEDQVLDEDYDGDADGDCGGRPPPNQPCLCCHCRALVCDNQCKTVSKTLDSAMYDPVAEMKFFIDSVVFDLQAMDHVMKKNLINPKAPRPSPCMGNAPGESFPVSITDVSSLGCRALYIRWELQDCSGVGGYEIYVDGHLTNRLYSHRHEAVVVSNVDVSKRHQIILRALAIGQEFPGDERSNCAMINAHPEMRVGAQQPWTPSVYFYEP